MLNRSCHPIQTRIHLRTHTSHCKIWQEIIISTVDRFDSAPRAAAAARAAAAVAARVALCIIKLQYNPIIILYDERIPGGRSTQSPSHRGRRAGARYITYVSNTHHLFSPAPPPHPPQNRGKRGGANFYPTHSFARRRFYSLSMSEGRHTHTYTLAIYNDDGGLGGVRGGGWLAARPSI